MRLRCRACPELTGGVRLLANGSGDAAAAAQKFFQPSDVVVTVDDFLLAHQSAEQGQRRFHPVDDKFVESAFEPHQAFTPSLAMHDELADK